eukprot:Em0001g2342a
MSFAVPFSIVQCVVGLWNATFTEISGFLYANTRSFTTTLIGIILGHGVQFVITLVTSYMTYRTVKNGIVEVDNDNSVTRSVLIMNVTTIVTILISKAVPLPAFVYWATTTGRAIAHALLSLLLAVEPLYVLFLFITIHKTIRCAIVAAISGCIKSSNSVWPKPVSRQTECK